jgi:hypothetical protein
MVASLLGKRGYGDKGSWVKYWAHLGGWNSLGVRFESYEPFISLIFQIISGRGKPRITETADMLDRLYIHTHMYTNVRV